MKDQSKKSWFDTLFGQKSCCCTVQIEENETEEQTVSDEKNEGSQPTCCGLPENETVASRSSEQEHEQENA